MLKTGLSEEPILHDIAQPCVENFVAFHLVYEFGIHVLHTYMTHHRLTEEDSVDSDLVLNCLKASAMSLVFDEKMRNKAEDLRRMYISKEIWKFPSEKAYSICADIITASGFSPNTCVVNTDDNVIGRDTTDMKTADRKCEDSISESTETSAKGTSLVDIQSSNPTSDCTCDIQSSNPTSCTCDICESVRNVSAAWSTWVPKTHIQRVNQELINKQEADKSAESDL